MPRSSSQPSPEPSAAPLRTGRRRRAIDRAASWLVTAGGLAIIASILGILVFILVEVWPLTQPARVSLTETVDASQPPLEAMVADEYRTHLAGLDRQGRVRVLRKATGPEGGTTFTEIETLDALAAARPLGTSSTSSSAEPSAQGEEIPGDEASGDGSPGDEIPGDEAEEESLEGDETENDQTENDQPRNDQPQAAAGAEQASPDAAPAGTAAAGPTLLRAATPPGSGLLTGATSDGRVLAVPVQFRISFEGQDRVVTPRLEDPFTFTLDPEGQPLGAYAVRLDGDGSGVAAARLADGSLGVVSRTVDENAFTGETSESLDRRVFEVPYPITSLAVDENLRSLYAGTEGGEILWWRLEDGLPTDLQVVSAEPSPVSALTLLLGGQSLVVGQEDGSLSVWFPVRQGDDSFRLTRIRTLPGHGAAIRRLEPSRRGKSFLAGDAAGGLGLYHSTSDRQLWFGGGLVDRVDGLFFTTKADGAYALGDDRIALLDVHNPHPETTWQTLFGKVWYEGYRDPTYVWQSTGGTDEFESKLSLTPLLIGTLKGTFYSLLIAIPLAIFGAMYLSQFMPPGAKRVLKPVIEIMASLPSVVLGFLAGLWLAPRVEQAVPALLLMGLVLPLTVILAGALWNRIPRALRNRAPAWVELALFAVALTLGGWLALAWGPALEQALFGGNFQAWLLDTTGLPYDQRNAIVVGIAMGFAVIPIIFAIAEDAFSNVPPNLVAGSLALGANRWQTVTRVVLPTASPGIFSAVMVGFGRAVGETMIVLMATGNTPIMDWNPFNGFRTLSANIAVEIPEAPQGGTLYRTLFLAALLLFVLTFLLNTVAEVVRQRLRERYSQL